jgi:hypothetical protein
MRRLAPATEQSCLKRHSPRFLRPDWRDRSVLRQQLIEGSQRRFSIHPKLRNTAAEPCLARGRALSPGWPISCDFVSRKSGPALRRLYPLLTILYSLQKLFPGHIDRSSLPNSPDQLPYPREMMIIVLCDKIQMIHESHRRLQTRVRNSSSK